LRDYNPVDQLSPCEKRPWFATTPPCACGPINDLRHVKSLRMSVYDNYDIFRLLSYSSLSCVVTYVAND